MFNAQEQREMAQLDIVSAQLAGAEAQSAQASVARQANTAGLIGGLAGIGGNLLTGLAQQGASPYAGSRGMASALDTSGMQVGIQAGGPSGIDLSQSPTVGAYGVYGMSTIPVNTPPPTIDTNYRPSFGGGN